MLHRESYVMPKEYESILNYLYKAEGGIIHRNKTEADITNGYGIYKAAHPTAKVWMNIDNCAKSLGINKPSSAWSKAEIDKINANLNKEEDKYLSYIFYSNYYKPAAIESLPPNCTIYGVSIYANGPKLYGRSIQTAINEFIAAGHLTGDKLLVDGQLGAKSVAALNAIKNLSPDKHDIFKNILLEVTKKQYIALADSNPAKYGQYKKGWLNRVESVRYA